MNLINDTLTDSFQFEVAREHPVAILAPDYALVLHMLRTEMPATFRSGRQVRAIRVHGSLPSFWVALPSLPLSHLIICD